MALCCPHSTKPGLKKEARKPENTLAKRESILLNIIALKMNTVNVFPEKDKLPRHCGIFRYLCYLFSWLGKVVRLSLDYPLELLLYKIFAIIQKKFLLYAIHGIYFSCI